MSQDFGKLGDDTGGHRRYHSFRCEGQGKEKENLQDKMTCKKKPSKVLNSMDGFLQNN
jgi:hypothetical protein